MMASAARHGVATAWLATACVALAIVLGSAVPARAQMESREAIALQNQILQLRRDLQTLSQQGGGRPAYVPPPSGGGGGVGGDIATQLLDRVTRLEDQIRQLQGRIDEVDNARQRQYDELAKQIGDMNFRLQNAGGAGAPPPLRAPAATPPALNPPAASTPSALGAAASAAPSSPAGPPVPVRRTPEMVLQEGNAALARRDYTVAEAAAREALATRGPRATDAQFLLAQALSGQRNYAQAAVAYDDAYKRNPSGLHAPDALLGVAMSLNALGGKKESCEALDQLRTTFPNPRPDLRDQVVAARQRAGCR